MLNLKEYDVLDHGLVADGKTLNTQALQNLIDKVSASGGGKIIFPKGEFVLSTVFIKDNIHIVFDGAKILGSLNFYDYLPDEKLDFPLYQDASHSFFHCSMFVAEYAQNISFTGKGVIDMRSVWDEENVRKIVNRGAKCIALKCCKNVVMSGFELYNATDLGIYFTACENVEIFGLKLQVYIDGISPDNCKNVKIYDCDVESGDDGIVFKSSYNLNKLGICENISVSNCKIKSRCNAIKFGTETNGGFKNIDVSNVDIRETRITGIVIESVDGAIVDGITIKNINMTNVNSPFFIHLGKRLRGPKGTKIGEIKNISIENVTATGPYERYECMPWRYNSYMIGDRVQFPEIFGIAESFDGTRWDENWQMTSNACGLIGHPLKNITFKNIKLVLRGGIYRYNREVPEEAQDYPEVYVYGKTLPAQAIYFRHIDNLTLENIVVKTEKPDLREQLVFDDVTNLKII